MELWQRLSDADRALGRLDAVAESRPNPDLFVAMYVRKESVLSSQIEGTQTSLVDLLEYEASHASRGVPADVGEVVNYVRALNHGIAGLAELPISQRLIRGVHSKLLQGVRGGERKPGEFRTSQNWIGPAGSSLSKATFVPPSVPDMVSALSELEKFIHNESPMPALIKIGLVHSQFETIHPFLDGNGRIGRLLITLMLCEQGILRRPLLYLSYYFKQNRQEYYDRLMAVRLKGDWEGWLKFFLRGVYEVSRQATDTAGRIVALREDHRRLIQDTFGRAANSLRLLDVLYDSPIISVKIAHKILGISIPAANNIVAQFVAAGLLTQTGAGKRDRVFSYQPYLDMFADETDVRVVET